MSRISGTIEQTYQIAEKLVRQIGKKDRQQAVVVALVGDLGAGKTTFAQGFARALGIKEKITSPTFIIMKKFQIPRNKLQTNSKFQIPKFKTLVHFDVYRLDKSEELLDLGWEKLVNDPQNIILVEWAEKIKKILPKNHILVTFKHISENQRTIEVRPQ
ncbi:tRNA (adenosine(37)-N6)-threonylcarbamoyltransferase complex ATPase subunit type 1 TsaE [Patescibacteria group bacterium]